MLRELYIKNFAIIKELTIDFTSGFNVLTGETGAGKSILIDAVGLLLGARASSELIRTGCDKAIIQGMFDIPREHEIYNLLNEYGFEYEDDDFIMFSREVSLNGKNKCRINGRPVTLSIFKSLGNKLVEIHGQHSNDSLFSEDKQLMLLDSFGGEKIAQMKQELKGMYIDIAKKNKELQELLGYNRNGLREKDLLQFQLDEIQKADLKENEEDELQKEKKKLEGSQELAAGCEQIYNLLYKNHNCAYDNISESIKILEGLVQYDQKLHTYLSELSSSMYMIEEVSREIRDYSESIHYNPQLLDEINNRLCEINDLKRKYGNSIREILKYRDEIANTLEKIENSTTKIETLETEISELKQEYENKAASLSIERNKVAQYLEKEIENNLKELALPQARFKIKLGILEKITAKGKDCVSFLFSSNPGEDLKPLKKIASGGELSRVMLAIKSILAQVDNINILIFDEIDTGVGGESIKKVAQKLSALGNTCQVICVTHSPIIAAKANNHFSIKKFVENNRTITRVKKLSHEEKIVELARMLGGSKAAEQHARSLLSQ